MKPRHAAALALVGWYLMVPPIGLDGMPDAKAPLSRWTIGLMGSYDTARACKDRKLKDLDAAADYGKKHPELWDDPATRKMKDSRWEEQCIASDDPRLK